MILKAIAIMAIWGYFILGIISNIREYDDFKENRNTLWAITILNSIATVAVVMA